MDKSILRLVILNDLMGLELGQIPINKVINPMVQSKLRNLKKTTDSITKMADDIFKEERIQGIFGELCDQINEIINDKIGEIV